MSKFVIVTMLEVNNEEFIHIRNGSGASDYTTLCGLDGGVSSSEQSQRAAPKGAKVNCAACLGIWKKCKEVRKSDFEDPTA